ncbi:MAG: type VI secretion system contractile sheath large subunit [Polyangia bacterium]|jgi:type VI secretion system protein ImpC
MADRSRAGIEMNFAFGKGPKSKLGRRPNAPMRLLVLGDFGGHGSRAQVRPGAELRPLRVDLDSFPSLFAKIAPRIQVRLGGQPPLTVAIGELEDFHPDRLFTSLEFFAPMRELRRQLQDPKTFAVAAAMVGSVAPIQAAPTVGDVAAHGEDLQRLLGRPATAEAPAARPASAVDAMIREAVAPHVVGGADPRQADLVAAVDAMTGELMRALLHDRGFQAVEAAWRGLDRLVRTLELDELLQVHVLDVSRAELAEDFAAAPTLTEAALYGIVVDRVGDKPWSLLVDCTAYQRGQDDAALLARLGTLAQQVDAAVVASMDWAAYSAGFASPEDERAWTALRNSSAATSVALTLPNILLRLPYGRGTDPIERFAFTEQASPPVSERYLWGSSALAVAQLLAQSFAEAGGWDFAPGDESSIDDLPTHVTKQNGESVQTPCAQTWLPESKIDALIRDGLMPVVSAQGRGEVRVPRFQSIALPSAALAGRWRND